MPKEKGEACYVVNKITGMIVSEHVSISDAARVLGLNSAISRQIKHRALFDRSRYAVRLVEDYDPHESFEGKRRGVPVVASRAGEIRVYVDRRELADDLGYTTSTIAEFIVRGKPTSSGWMLRRMPHMGALNGILGLEEQ